MAHAILYYIQMPHGNSYLNYMQTKDFSISTIETKHTRTIQRRTRIRPRASRA